MTDWLIYMRDLPLSEERGEDGEHGEGVAGRERKDGGETVIRS